MLNSRCFVPPFIFIVDLCIIGGGISGLAAACTAAGKPDQTQPSILLLEADSCVGGRVRSDYTDDRFILDRGFAGEYNSNI